VGENIESSSQRKRDVSKHHKRD